jgi:Tfp pilus assembly protein PilX
VRREYFLTHPRLLGSDDGFAMIVAMIILMVTTMLAGVAVAVAVQTNGSTRHDVSKKNALEAAEAGLQVALYRLNMLRPDDAHCVGDVVATADSTRWCASSTYTLGNGSAYQYYTKPTLTSSDTCVGLTVTNSNSNISQRCITSVGTTNGVSARSQIRAATFAARPLFPISGITGLNGITDSNNAQIGGWEASNAKIQASNNVKITGSIELGPKGTYTFSNGASNPPKVALSSPLVLGPVNPGTSNQTSLANCPGRITSCNDDYRITNYTSNPSHPTAPYDQSSGVSLTAGRVLSMSNNASITLGGGLYNFCSFTAANNVTIALAPGVKTEIIIDSPDDPNSGCAAGTGNLSVSNNATWSNPGKDSTGLQIYVYGTNNMKNVVNFSNNSAFWGVLYAPLSTINLSNNAVFNGAISGYVVNASNNFSFNWDSHAGTLQAQSTGLYYRTAWAQCTPAPTVTTDPGSGCG